MAVTILPLSAIALLGCGQNPIMNPGDGAVLFHDDFSTTLQEGWLLDGVNSNVSLTDRDGFLTLYPPEEIPEGDQVAPTALLRPLTGDFVVVTKFDFQTVTDLQSSGIVVQGADGRTVLLGVSEINQIGFRGVLMIADRRAGTQDGRALIHSDLLTIWLRLARVGTSYSGSFSADGVNFTPVGTSLTNDLSSTVLVGVGTLVVSRCTSNCDAHEPAEFDFFEVRNPSQ